MYQYYMRATLANIQMLEAQPLYGMCGFDIIHRTTWFSDPNGSGLIKFMLLSKHEYNILKSHTTLWSAVKYSKLPIEPDMKTGKELEEIAHARMFRYD